MCVARAITPDVTDDQINTTEMGKTELYASCVSSIADILSQRLIMQCHDNDTLPDLANVL